MTGLYGTDTITLPLGLLTALATSELRMALFGLRALYGVMRFLHLVGMAGFVGSVVLVDVCVLGLFPDASLAPMRRPLVWVMHVTFGLTLATGLFLFVYNPLGIGLHSMFLPKLVLVALGLALAHGLRDRKAARRSVVLRRGGAAVSLALWLAVVGASTWNHVERPVKVADALRASSVGK
jgi:hypothetical protein